MIIQEQIRDTGTLKNKKPISVGGTLKFDQLQGRIKTIQNKQDLESTIDNQ